MAESIDPWAPKVAFWIKIHDFWALFWYRFFTFFRKWQKCEISEEYNAKRGSEPSKIFDFRIDVSLTFHVFSEPPPRGHFSRVKVPVYTQKSAPGRGSPPRRGRVWIGKLFQEFPSCRFPFLLGFLLDVLLVGDHLASKIGTRGRQKSIQKSNTFLNFVF